MRGALLLVCADRPALLGEWPTLRAALGDAAPGLLSEAMLSSALEAALPYISDGEGYVRQALTGGRYPYPQALVNEVAIALGDTYRLVTNQSEFSNNPGRGWKEQKRDIKASHTKRDHKETLASASNSSTASGKHGPRSGSPSIGKPHPQKPSSSADASGNGGGSVSQTKAEKRLHEKKRPVVHDSAQIKIPKTPARAYIDRAKAAAARGDWSSASNYYELATNIDGSSVEAWLGRFLTENQWVTTDDVLPGIQKEIDKQVKEKGERERYRCSARDAWIDEVASRDIRESLGRGIIIQDGTYYIPYKQGKYFFLWGAGALGSFNPEFEECFNPYITKDVVWGIAHFLQTGFKLRVKRDDIGELRLNIGRRFEDSNYYHRAVFEDSRAGGIFNTWRLQDDALSLVDAIERSEHRLGDVDDWDIEGHKADREWSELQNEAECMYAYYLEVLRYYLAPRDAHGFLPKEYHLNYKYGDPSYYNMEINQISSGVFRNVEDHFYMKDYLNIKFEQSYYFAGLMEWRLSGKRLWNEWAESKGLSNNTLTAIDKRG